MFFVTINQNKFIKAVAYATVFLFTGSAVDQLLKKAITILKVLSIKNIIVLFCALLILNPDRPTQALVRPIEDVFIFSLTIR